MEVLMSSSATRAENPGRVFAANLRQLSLPEQQTYTTASPCSQPPTLGSLSLTLTTWAVCGFSRCPTGCARGWERGWELRHPASSTAKGPFLSAAFPAAAALRQGDSAFRPSEAGVCSTDGSGCSVLDFHGFEADRQGTDLLVSICSLCPAKSTGRAGPLLPWQALPRKRLNPSLGGDPVSAKPCACPHPWPASSGETEHLCIRGKSPPRVIPSGRKVNSQGLCIPALALSPGTSTGLTIFSAEEPEQLLQLFLIYTQGKRCASCCGLIHVCAGEGSREAHVFLHLG